ncbi:MAG: DUF3261 domain-containing protein [Treponema sp.]|jgi:hypothetical protein|nr:DUF3261 domain-containing protein [Treponema sp.]
MAQQITGSYGEQGWVMEAWVQADETRINMTIFNSFGGTLGDLSFRDGEIRFTSGILPASLKAEYILADFQFCFYKPETLAAALEDAGLTLMVERTATEDGGYRETRAVFDGKDRIIDIEKTSSSVTYANHLRGYAYTLEGAF